jgi:hypothetical protein
MYIKWLPIWPSGRRIATVDDTLPHCGVVGVFIAAGVSMPRLTFPLACFFLPSLALASSLESQQDHHIVVKGDTLWDISAAALDDPWKWPDIWAINRGLIRNPNWIYPGQDISLDSLAEAQPSQAQPSQAQPSQAQPAQAQPAQAQPAQPSNGPRAFAHVISIYSGTSQNAQRNVVMIDRGRRDGVRNGLVLALYQGGKAKKDASQAPEPLGASYAQVQVYRTFDDVAYALVTQETSAVKLMDVLSVVPAVSSVGAAPSEQAATAPATPR